MLAPLVEDGLPGHPAADRLAQFGYPCSFGGEEHQHVAVDAGPAPALFQDGLGSLDGRGGVSPLVRDLRVEDHQPDRVVPRRGCRRDCPGTRGHRPRGWHDEASECGGAGIHRCRRHRSWRGPGRLPNGSTTAWCRTSSASAGCRGRWPRRPGAEAHRRTRRVSPQAGHIPARSACGRCRAGWREGAPTPDRWIGPPGGRPSTGPGSCGPGRSATEATLGRPHLRR